MSFSRGITGKVRFLHRLKFPISRHTKLVGSTVPVTFSTTTMSSRVSPAVPASTSQSLPIPSKEERMQELRNRQIALAEAFELTLKKLQELETNNFSDEPMAKCPESESIQKSAEISHEHFQECKAAPAFFPGLYKILTCSPIMFFLITTPFALASVSWSPPITFVLSMIAIIALAKLLGEATVSLHNCFTSWRSPYDNYLP